MAMFIRVKRKKTTYFLHCDPSETVLEIKQKIQALSDNPVDCQRLILLSSQLVLEDSKSLADQKVENDAVVALCLKTSAQLKERETARSKDRAVSRFCPKPSTDCEAVARESESSAPVPLPLRSLDMIRRLAGKTMFDNPRVHRISTGLRPPPDPKQLLELVKALMSKPATPKRPQEVDREGQLGEDAQPLPPAPEPILLERAMSTLLRTPFKPPPPTPEEIAKKEAADKEAAKLEAAKKLGKDEAKKQALQKDVKDKEDRKGKKEDSKKGEGTKKAGKQGVSKKDEIKGKLTGKQKVTGKKKGKKGDKDEKDKPEVEEILPIPDSAVWEDICIDRLADYSTVVDSD